MNEIHISGIGLAAPGLAGWEEGQRCLAGETDYEATPLPRLTPEILPPNERRRTSPIMRLALAVAYEAAQLASVFASASGDMEIIHAICETLASSDPAISPTQFHNSVHNAPAGYWSIASKSRAPSTSLSAFDASFAAGLMEAATQVGLEGGSVLLAAYDVPPPFPISEARPVREPFGCALVLTQEASAASSACLTLELVKDQEETVLDHAGLEALRRDNPAARALPLLKALAEGATARLVLPYLPGRQLLVECVPC
jgi:hypothetical protein